jgi:hypothetical protein
MALTPRFCLLFLVNIPFAQPSWTHHSNVLPSALYRRSQYEASENWSGGTLGGKGGFHCAPLSQWSGIPPFLASPILSGMHVQAAVPVGPLFSHCVITCVQCRVVVR